MSDAPNLPALKAHGVALHEAILQTYAAIKAAKQLVGERRPTKAILEQFEIIEKHLDVAYIEASTQEIAHYCRGPAAFTTSQCGGGGLVRD